MTVEARVTWVENRRFVGYASSGHAIVIDGALTARPSPMELVLLGLTAAPLLTSSTSWRKETSDLSFEVIAQAERAADHPRLYGDIRRVRRARQAIGRACGGRRDPAIDGQILLCGRYAEQTARITTGYRSRNRTAESGRQLARPLMTTARFRR